MASTIYVGGHYDGTVTNNSPLHEGEEFDADGGPVERYAKTDEVNEDGHVIYRYVGRVG